MTNKNLFYSYQAVQRFLVRTSYIYRHLLTADRQKHKKLAVKGKNKNIHLIPSLSMLFFCGSAFLQVHDLQIHTLTHINNFYCDKEVIINSLFIIMLLSRLLSFTEQFHQWNTEKKDTHSLSLLDITTH